MSTACMEKFLNISSKIMEICEFLVLCSFLVSSTFHLEVFSSAWRESRNISTRLNTETVCTV